MGGDVPLPAFHCCNGNWHMHGGGGPRPLICTVTEVTSLDLDSGDFVLIFLRLFHGAMCIDIGGLIPLADSASDLCFWL